MQKLIIGSVALIIILFFLGQHLNPLSKQMFIFHDGTQVGRASTFADNIRQGQIPPRVAAKYSFNMGYPLFNYYSPAAYWITAVPILLDVYPITALKLSFLGAIALAFLSMLFWLHKRFNFNASLLGATAYVTCPYFAVEIFIRGSLSEAWFLGLFPLAFYMLDRVREHPSFRNIFTGSIVASLLFTVHNVMSPLSLILLVIYVMLHRIKKGYYIIILGLLLGAYFLIPAVVEMKQTHAIFIASKTDYKDHFLCISQLWSTPIWGFGGSSPGCDDDGFSFKLGKIHIILAGIGVVLAIWFNWKKKSKLRNEVVAMLILGFGSLFLTLYSSEFIWHSFERLLKIFQFPWRFLVFCMFTLSYFIAYGSDRLKKLPLYLVATLLAGMVLVIANDQYFRREGISYNDYAVQYLSDDYLTNHIAFHIPEYLPKSAVEKAWFHYQSGVGTPKFLQGIIEPSHKEKVNIIKKDQFHRIVKTNAQEFYINVHYAPYWNISIDGKQYKPSMLDSLGRPRVKLSSGEHIIDIKYKQTSVEVLSNFISLATLAVLILGFTKYGPKTAKK